MSDGERILLKNGFIEHLDSDATRPLLSPVHKIFEMHAQENPYSLAVRYNHHELTYAQLNQSANRLAHQLKNMKIGAEDCVAVCLEPSPDILIALLGILKAGAVYVPLDPSYPIARIQNIIRVIKPLVIISEKQLSSQLDFDRSILIQLDELPALLPFDNLEEFISINQTAYIFNTSGSTGNPKSVMASYSNLYHFMTVTIEKYGMDHATVMPSLARCSFSISLFELLCPLVAGGTVWILDREHILDPARMVATLSRVTAFHCGPSLLKGLTAYIHLKYKDFSIFANVRHVSTGGDMVPPELLESLKEIFLNADVFVIYGSTEIACMGCTYHVPRDRKITKTYVGHPFENMSFLIVNEHLEPVSNGAEGEVCFTGGGVAKGYLNLPEMTQDRFYNFNGKRFYRMGDVGRFNEIEGLELLGRVDFQIKVRGMRVELAEVEYQLRSAPNVKDAVVVSKDLGVGENTLVAYVVFKDPNITDISSIHAYLMYQLPEYMIPACYVYLQELPLNHNLKLDRKALPHPNTVELHRVVGGPMRAPETATEKTIAKLWCKLLGTNEVGLNDHFFDLGGHSLLAIELLQHIESTFNVAVEGMEVLRESLEVLALIIDQRLGQLAYNKKESSEYKSPILVSSFYFGSNLTLYGVLYKPKLPVKKTVLICSPFEYELSRSIFVIQQLSRRLAIKGFAVLQFHYFGTGDSLGDNAIDNLNQWSEDIDTAINELSSRYAGAPMVAIGIRLGASLLWNAKNIEQLEKVILVDPVVDGRSYLEELHAIHMQKISDLMYARYNRPPRQYSALIELLGLNFTPSALVQLKNVTIEPSRRNKQIVTWLATHAKDSQFSTPQAIKAVKLGWKLQAALIEPEVNWLNRHLVYKLPDTGLSKLLVNIVEGL